MALQGKWLWRYFKEGEELWRKIIAARWGDATSELILGRMIRPHGYGPWKKFLMGWTRLNECIQWCVDKGNRIKFWEDV